MFKDPSGMIAWDDFRKFLGWSAVAAIGYFTGGLIYDYLAPIIANSLGLGAIGNSIVATTIASAAASLGAGFIGGVAATTLGIGNFSQGFLVGGLFGGFGAATSAANPRLFNLSSNGFGKFGTASFGWTDALGGVGNAVTVLNGHVALNDPTRTAEMFNLASTTTLLRMLGMTLGVVPVPSIR